MTFLYFTDGRFHEDFISPTITVWLFQLFYRESESYNFKNMQMKKKRFFKPIQYLMDHFLQTTEVLVSRLHEK